MSKPNEFSCTPLHNVLEQARQALNSTLIVYQDGDDEPGDMEKLIGYVQMLLNEAGNIAAATRQQNEQLRQLVLKVKAQRDDAIQERNDALIAQQDAYLEGLLMAEEIRNNLLDSLRHYQRIFIGLAGRILFCGWR